MVAVRLMQPPSKGLALSLSSFVHRSLEAAFDAGALSFRQRGT